MLRTAESISDIHKVGSYGHIVWNQCINIGFTYATATATSSIFYQNNKQHSFYLLYHLCRASGNYYRDIVFRV